MKCSIFIKNLAVLLFLNACNPSGTKTILVAEVFIIPNTATVSINEKIMLKAVIVPEDADNQSVNWKSDNPEIATVSDNGQVNGVSAGATIITITTNDGNKTAYSTVTVDNPVTGVQLDQNNITLVAGEMIQLNAIVGPGNANQNVVWTSNAPSIATVTDGVVTAMAPGTATISVSSAENSFLRDNCIVSVEYPLVQGRVIFTYVGAGGTDIPDAKHITHIGYAFGRIDGNYNLYVGGDPNRLSNIVALKKVNPDLKVLLSVGGGGSAFSGPLSPLAKDPNKRLKFVADCKSIMANFNLDGIDLNWEYPWTAEDSDNHLLLMQEIRAGIDDNKLLTYASGSRALYFHHRELNPIIDFVNIMCYDIAHPPYHHSGLYRSELSGDRTAEEGVLNHVNAGIPMNKLTMGIPFYALGRNGIADWTPYPAIMAMIQAGTHIAQWDDVAKAPYLINAATGSFDASYDDPRSIAEKCKYINENGMKGAMTWVSGQDDSEGTLTKAVWYGVMKVK